MLIVRIYQGPADLSLTRINEWRCRPGDPTSGEPTSVEAPAPCPTD
jgi:hypothetical protein